MRVSTKIAWGRLEVGMMADLVILQGDMASLSQQGPLRIAAALTVCDGQITHEALT